ncbi:MAG TPA: sensor histidine kinase, partial [Spirochaetota bacterium]|nr:sensor histidine kinase [Spirochaetota bacterium]
MWKVVQRTRSDERIRASLREKEVLLKEVHHRVKNNMQVIASMINLQFRDFEKTLARLTPGDISRDLQGRIRSMAMIHEKLYQSGSFTSVNFGDYARNLGAALFRSYQMDETRVKLAIDAADVPLG